MKLRDWRAKEGISQAALAHTLTELSGERLYQSHVSVWERGGLPRKRWLNRLAALTKGEVTANDFAAE